MSYRSLHWEDVEPGAALPPIVYELSLLRLVAYVRATGLYDYVHFDRDYARSIGSRDAFMATPHVSGLFSRLLTDWSGPEAALRSMSFSMNGQSCAGDILTISGRVGKKYRNEQGDFLVDVVDLNIGHTLSPHAATGAATLALPSRTQPQVRTSLSDGTKAPPSAGEHVPDFLRPVLGQPRTLDRPIRPVTADAIHLLCECLEDWNPLYWDNAYAEKSTHGGIIAPPTSLFFGVGSGADAGVGYMKPGAHVPEPVKQELTGIALLLSLRETFLKSNSAFTFTDFPELVVVGFDCDFRRPVKPGDLLRQTQEIVDCSALKKTKLGRGYFMTLHDTTYNQRDEVVRVLTKRSFYYHP